MSKWESTKKLVNEKSVMAVIRASRPSFRNPHDKIAFVVHASFLAAGYFLNATGTPAFSHDALTSSSTDEVGIDQWNEYAYNYAFVYINPEKGSKKVLVKCLAENGRLIVDAWSGYGSSPFHLEIDVGDYTEESADTNYGSHFMNLRILLSSIYKVILKKFSYSSEGSSSSHPSSSSTQPSSSSCGRSRGLEDNIKKPSVRVFVLEHLQPFCPLGKPAPLVYPSVGSYLFPELGAGAYPPRIVFPPVYPFIGNNLFPGHAAEMSDFGYGRGTRRGQLNPCFFGGIGGGLGFFGGQRGVRQGGLFDRHGQSGALGFEPNQPSIFWWHWWRVWFPKRKRTSGTLRDLEHSQWR